MDLAPRKVLERSYRLAFVDDSEERDAYWEEENLERWRTFIRGARRLRDVPPARTLEMAFELTEFARELGQAVE